MAILGSGYSFYSPYVEAAAAQYQLPSSFLTSVLQQESSFNPNVRDSPTGAIGIAQFEPGTAAAIGINPRDPIASIFGAAKLLRQNLDRSGGSLADAASMYYSGRTVAHSSQGAGYASQVLGRASSLASGALSTASSALSGKVSGLLKSGLNALLLTNPATAPFAIGASLLGGGSGGGLLGGMFGIGGDSWFTQFKNWITQGRFFSRIGLALVALIFIFAAFYLLGRSTPEFKAAAKAFA